MFLGFKEGEIFVEMKKLGKKKSFAYSWEGPFMFVKYLDGHCFLEQDEGGRVCVVKGNDDKLWDRLRHDL
jgi:hypothetical protein